MQLWNGASNGTREQNNIDKLTFLGKEVDDMAAEILGESKSFLQIHTYPKEFIMKALLPKSSTRDIPISN